MVYTGPSRACERCRQKKKSCDQQRPECSRCIGAGAACVGYRSDFEVVYRDENEKTKTRSLVPKKRRLSRRLTPPRQEESLTLVAIPTAAEDILIFFHCQFVVPAQKCGWPGPISSLPEKYATAPKNACFKPALWATSYAILSRKKNDQHYQNKAREFYISALEAISKALENNEYDDSTMMAIALLDLFQFIMDEEANTYGKHLNGLRAVLERRRRKSASDRALNSGSRTDNGDFIFDVLPQTQALLMNLKRRTLPSQGSVDWVAGLNQIHGAACVAEAYLQFAQISAQASQLCDIVRRNQEVEGLEEYADFLELISLVRIAEGVDEHNEKWWNTGHPKWHVTRKTSSNSTTTDGQGSCYDCYSSLWTACVWNTYRAARTVLRNTMIECAGVLEQSAYCNSDIRASVPLVLGEVDSRGHKDKGEATALSGQTLLWPLCIVQECKSVEHKDQVWASRSLAEIGHRTGIYRLVAIARKDLEENEEHPAEEAVNPA